MEALPDDPEARRKDLERWAQGQRLGPRTRRARLRAALVVWRGRRASRLELAAQSADRLLEQFANRLWDRGLDTSVTVHLHEYLLDDRVHYLASAWHVLPRALRHVGISNTDTFVEFGCGKGRVVHQAARRPFRRVIGVEVSPELAEVARTVLAARADRHRCRNVEIVVSDVKQYPVPDDFTIGYFFRPFGDDTLAMVLRGIVESIDRNPRRVRLIYVWPTDRTRSMILGTDRFRLVKQLSSSLTNPRSGRIVIFESH